VGGHVGLEFSHVSPPQDAVEGSVKTGIPLFYLPLIHGTPLFPLIPELTPLGNLFLLLEEGDD